jgi:hypothetical protein
VTDRPIFGRDLAPDDGQIDMPPEPGILRHYQIAYSIILWGMCIAGLAVGICVIYVGYEIYGNEKYGQAGATLLALGLVWCLAFSYFSVVVFMRRRPILITDEMISTLLHGRPWKTLYWQKVQRIECIRVFDSSWQRYRHSICVSDGRAKIRIDDDIRGFDEIIEKLNRLSRRYGIEIWSVDLGVDTFRRIRATVQDPIEKKHLLREGIRVKVDQLAL